MSTTRSLKKNHRQPQQKQNPSMAAPSAPPRRRKPRTLATVSALLFVFLVISVISLLLVSSNAWRAFQHVVSYDSITVVNEFPHDPQAFTQVNFHFYFYFFFFVLFLLSCILCICYFFSSNYSSCFFNGVEDQFVLVTV